MLERRVAGPYQTPRRYIYNAMKLKQNLCENLPKKLFRALTTFILAIESLGWQFTGLGSAKCLQFRSIIK